LETNYSLAFLRFELSLYTILREDVLQQISTKSFQTTPWRTTKNQKALFVRGTAGYPSFQADVHVNF